ncbi:MAG: MucB/RseB C-terminal domain-containing protein [Azoarcus sp.]|jgi:sigma-E factor negative regulatory protein RseB|nr:MucB/RseB C-terminal domain-containing protein [Azoarcus sp.]
MKATKPLLIFWLGALCGQPVVGLAVDQLPDGRVPPPVVDSGTSVFESGLVTPPVVDPVADAAATGTTVADPANEPLAWLDRIAQASQRLNYIGTFSYQTGRRLETSRIVHRYADGEESERLEVLDGSPREVVRKGGEVRCLLPAQRTVIVSRVGTRGSFPGRLMQSYAGLAGNYNVRLGEAGRVAAHEARKVVLEPRDGLRFGHVLWAEVQSGLLLKSQVLDAGGGVVEQFAFSDVRIGGDVGDELLVAQAKPQEDWSVLDMGDGGTERAEDGKRIDDPLPGFVLVSRVHHHNGGTVQMVFSDGLAAISVFIEQAEAGAEARGGFPGGGAVHAFERIVDGKRITVLGEVPPRAAQQAAEAMDAAVRK